jgi:hypothetical protein
MKITVPALLCATALVALPFSAQAESADSGIEFALMPKTETVTLLNEGGKYVTVDLKHIPKGGTCRMDDGAIIAKMGPGAPGTTRVRFAAPQLSSGGCPFMTEFDLPDTDYAAARAAFVQKKEEAAKKVDDLKKQLGDKWHELTGSKE